MNWRIQVTGSDPVLSFAAQELARCIRTMQPGTDVLCMRSTVFDARPGVLYIGTAETFSELLPAVRDTALDDALYIRVENGAGIIAGSNPRAALIAVYRYLHACGCRWVRPGADGEYMPKTDLSKISVHRKEAAAYRHRGWCIEGSNSYQNIADIIDWLPKVGMNAYFNQFLVPHTFFDRWYSHQKNPHKMPSPVSIDEVHGMTDLLTDEIKRRGLLYHAVGHSWTCEPFGIEGSGWETKDYFIPEESRAALAELDGVRDLFGGIPLNTQLCFSQGWVRERIVTAIRDYCAANPRVDCLHFWLGDGTNNHCECSACQNTRPADYYVQMLNALDDALQEAGLATRVVFLVYVDLLWEPETERINNPDRFILMFAPITRTYSHAFTEGLGELAAPLSPYVRNRLEMPRSVTENIARLRRWQDQFHGDSFDFDYHLMWDHYGDPGYTECARILFEDMKNLGKIGLDGMISCQTQRVFLPNGLPAYAMASALWDRHADFDVLSAEYYEAAYGTEYQQAADYLHALTHLFDPVALRGERKPDIERLAQVPAQVHAFLPFIDTHVQTVSDAVQRKSWVLLRLHAGLVSRMAALLIAACGENNALCDQKMQELTDYAAEIEDLAQDAFDLFEYLNTVGNIVRRIGAQQ